MRTIFSTILALAVACVASAADSRFDCVIKSDRTTYTIGQAPIITVSIANKTAKEVILAGCLDGSDPGWRYPKCRIEILDAAGNPVPDRAARCGNMNVLRAADFAAVPAGGVFDPFAAGFFPPHQLLRFPVTKPGDYKVRFHCSTADRLQDYFGDERLMRQPKVAPEIQRLVKRVPKLDLMSNELKLKFTAKPE